MADNLAPVVTAEEAAAAAAFDAQIGGDESQPEPTPERDYEAEARADGWVSQEEWVAQGKDPDKHRDAQAFVELSDNDPAVLRKKYTETKRDYERTVAQLTQATKATIERQKQEAEARYQQELYALKAERDQLLQQYRGDPRAAAQIADNYEQAKANVALPPPRETLEWIASRPAFNADKAFQAAAIATMDVIEQQDMPGRSSAEQYAELDRRLAARWPEHYQQAIPANVQPANGAPPAGSRQMGGVPVAKAAARKSWDSLPADAKKMHAMMVDDLGKDAPSKEQWAKDFYNE